MNNPALLHYAILACMPWLVMIAPNEVHLFQVASLHVLAVAPTP